jgi:hypothetical protein
MIHKIKSLVLVVSAAWCMAASAADAPVTAREAAPHDLTGNWVSIVTEDWRYRMVTAPRGDFLGLPLTPMAQEIANGWDPQADTAAGLACKAYGAGGLMRIPTRLNISWANDNILSIETDAGQQTRLLKFGSEQDGAGAGSLQGVSNASWDLQREGGRRGPVVNGTLDVTTTAMQPGYFRRNGIPYGEQAKMTEYFEMVTEANGDQYLIVISVLEDPQYLTQPVMTSTNFKREPDDSKWNPSACIAQ